MPMWRSKLRRAERAEGKPASAADLYAEQASPNVTPADVMKKLPPEASAAMRRVGERLAQSTPTNAPVEKGGFVQPDGKYTPERQALHEDIVGRILTPEAIARATPAEGQKPVVTMLGGRGGSGKSWFTREGGPVDTSKTLLIDSDWIKGQLPGFEGWNAALYHEESDHLLEEVGAMARELGLNVVYDATMKSGDRIARRMADHIADGYEVHGYYMFVTPEEAATRAARRFWKDGKASGRYVPPEVVLSNQKNEENFDAVKGSMAKWGIYSNMTREGPQLVSRSEEAK